MIIKERIIYIYIKKFKYELIEIDKINITY